MVKNNIRCVAITGRSTRCRRINNFVSEYCNQHDYYIPEQPEKELTECGICLDSPKDAIKLNNCIHQYCQDCIYKWIIINNTCPTCRTKVDNNTVNTGIKRLLFIEYIIDITFVEYSTTTLNPEELVVFNNHFGILFKYFTPYNMLKYYQITEHFRNNPELNELFNKIKVISEIKYFKSSDTLKSIPGGSLYVFTN